MKNVLKLGAVVLAIVMVLSMSVTAFASGTATLTGGEVGGFTAYDSGNPSTTAENSKQSLDKTVIIEKDLTVYNPNSHVVGTNPVYAPAFSYVYTVSPATISSYTVTDATTDHASGTAVTAPVNSGITTGLVVNGGNTGDSSSAVGYLDLTNTTALAASSSGETNNFDISFDFSNVSFTQPGVYRYQIVETIIGSDHSTAKTYSQVAVADGTNNTLYLDVYVDGTGNIYGYVCMTANGNVTTETQKTSGFMATSNGADSYYTYDLTLSKDVVNDNYAQNNIAFPFTVIFNNTENYATTFTITETAENGSTGFSPASASAPTWSGVPTVKEGGNITYTGIPAGVDVDVYETNIVTGVTYTVATSVNNGTATTDNNVSWGTTPTSAVAQTTRENYQSTKATVDTTAISTTAAQSVAITNTLLLISPTGVALRVAPYALMLGVGLFLVLFMRRRKNQAEA